MQTVSYACGLLCSDIFSKRKKGESSDFDQEFKDFKVSTGFDSPDHYRGNLQIYLKVGKEAGKYMWVQWC